jgi:hypothetical protein
MKTFATLLFVAMLLVRSREASALCGDLNGDNKKTTADALALLKSAVGQNVNLMCLDTTPSRIRFYNPFDCTTGSDIATLTFNDSDESYEFTADFDVSSPYQTIDDTTIDNIEIDVCGGEYTFNDPFHLAPNHSYTLFMVLVDPDIYGEGSAYAILYDEGEPVVATAAAAADPAGEPAISLGSLRQ